MASITRRLFLRNVAAAAPLTVVPAVALATTTENHAEENPVLLALEGPLNAAVAEQLAAAKAYSEAYAIAERLWTRAPEAITGSGEIERDFLGGGYGDARRVRSAAYYRFDVRAQKRWKKITPAREEARRRTLELLALAEQYEANCVRALEVSQIREARERVRTAVDELGRVVNAVHVERARTMADIRLKAKALQAWGQVGRYDRMLVAWKLEGEDWGAGLAASILEVLEA